MWWLTPVISAIGRLRQDEQEFRPAALYETLSQKNYVSYRVIDKDISMLTLSFYKHTYAHIHANYLRHTCTFT